MTVQMRPMLDALPAYVPGRTVPGAIKLASNESPYPPLPYVLERITAAAAQAHRYPDNFGLELSVALAERHGVDVDQIAVGGGSVALCTQLVQALADADDEVVYGWRSFEAYPIIATVAGASSVQVPLREHAYDLAAMAAAVTGKTRLIFVCNPNNPTGTARGGDALIEFLESVPGDVVIALDEAYREFVTDASIPDGTELLREHPNVVVLRTFSKAYGLAGLRVGYAIAGHPTIARALRQTQVPFALSSVAQAAALASLEAPAQQQMHTRVAEVAYERDRVRDALLADGYDVPPSQANFVWLPLGDATAQWAAGCEEHGVIVRAFAGAGARVTISTAAENDAFLRAAAQLRPR